jgi:hypothetical protein
MTINPDINVEQLLTNWTNGQKSSVFDALSNDHPGLTALVLMEGIRRKVLKVTDVNHIVNILIDRRVEALHEQEGPEYAKHGPDGPDNIPLNYGCQEGGK